MANEINESVGTENSSFRMRRNSDTEDWLIGERIWEEITAEKTRCRVK